MLKKPEKRDMINLFFSAFLILAFTVCAHFFSDYTATLSQPLSTIISALIYVVFGLLVFYATRVGDGKAVKRFSIVTLIVLDIPMLYIIVASIAEGLPLHDIFVSPTGGLSVIVTLASIALGYGIPYTFLSGYELAEEAEAADENTDDAEMLEGGLEADLADADDDEETVTENVEATADVDEAADTEDEQNTEAEEAAE